MPFDCRMEPDRRRGILTLRGRVDAVDFIAAMRALYGHPEWQPDFDALWDAGGITQLVIEPADLGPISEGYRNVETRMGSGRAAFVASRDVVHVITQLLLHRLRNPNRERRTFVRLDDAVAWLNEREA
ncbi:MAG: hypothetical protein ABJF88_10785 [Rhodothermales bacterium]